MPHLVKYTKGDGQTGDHEVEDLHEAIAYVEHLRNDEGAKTAQIFRIEEVSFEFKPYYRVELGSSSSTPKMISAVAPAPAPVDEVATAPMWTPPAEPAPAEAPAAVMAAVEPTPADDVVDPWADAPPPPADAHAHAHADEGEHAGTNGRRGLFGR